MFKLLLLAYTTCLFVGCSSGGKSGTDETINDVQSFTTGYEPNEVVGCEYTDSGTLCGDASQAYDYLLYFEPQPSTDWHTWDLEHPEAAMSVYYEVDAPPESRSARIIEDPTMPGNHVLRMQVTDALIPSDNAGHTKGRVQTQTAFSPPLTELYYRQRIYLHPDLNLLLSYPPDGDSWWLGIVFQEVRAGSPPNGDPYSFKMDFNLVPNFTTGCFNLVSYGEKKSRGDSLWRPVWGAADEVHAVPIGQWFTFEVAYQQGDAESGRFVGVLTVDGDSKPLIVLDIPSWTYSPDAPAPVSLNLWGGAQKVYSSDNVINYIRDNGGSTQIYFDDLFVGPNWPKGWTPPAATQTAFATQ